MVSRGRRVSVWRTELRVLWPAIGVLGIAALFSSTLYGRDLAKQATEAAVVAVLFGLVLGVWSDRMLKRDLANAVALPDGVVRETHRQTIRRAVRDASLLALMVAFAVDVYAGDLGDIAGLLLGIAVVARHMERSLARWENVSGTAVWTRRGVRKHGQALFHSRELA